MIKKTPFRGGHSQGEGSKLPPGLRLIVTHGNALWSTLEGKAVKQLTQGYDRGGINK